MKYILMILAMFVVSTPAFTNQALADDVPQCNAQRAGQLTCMAGKSCECMHFNASLMKGTPEGYRWDCGINRGPCLDNGINVEASQPQYNGPSSVSFGSDTSISNNASSTPVTSSSAVTGSVTSGNSNANNTGSNTNTNTNSSTNSTT